MSPHFNGLIATEKFFPGHPLLRSLRIIKLKPVVETTSDGIGRLSDQGAVAPGFVDQHLISSRPLVSIFAARNIITGELICLKRWQTRPYVDKETKRSVWSGRFMLIQSGSRPYSYVEKEFRLFSKCSHGCIRAFVLYPLLQALKHIHSLGVVHNDVKPENIFLSVTQPMVKLGDFGGACEVEDTSEKWKMKKIKGRYAEGGTDFFVSPEVYTLRKCCLLSDIWSAGMTVMLASPAPYDDSLGQFKLRWYHSTLRTDLLSMPDLFYDCLRKKVISSDDATEKLFGHFFANMHYLFTVTDDARKIFTETYPLVRKMIHFDAAKRCDASSLLSQCQISPLWSQVCLGWGENAEGNELHVFKRISQLVGDVLASL